MAVTLGSEGLEQVSMIIPQYTSFPASFLINDEDGHAVDLTG